LTTKIEVTCLNVNCGEIRDVRARVEREIRDGRELEWRKFTSFFGHETSELDKRIVESVY
jgi:hypothetical protein